MTEPQTETAEIPHTIVEYSVDGGRTWHHFRTTPTWAADADERKIARDRARELHGNVEHVITRFLSEDDPRAELNRPPAPPQYLVVHDVAHTPDAATPTTALCGIGAWEKNLTDNADGLACCAQCQEVADIELTWGMKSGR